jgi:hypothetical protein
MEGRRSIDLASTSSPSGRWGSSFKRVGFTPKVPFHKRRDALIRRIREKRHQSWLRKASVLAKEGVEGEQCDPSEVETVDPGEILTPSTTRGMVGSEQREEVEEVESETSMEEEKGLLNPEDTSMRLNKNISKMLRKFCLMLPEHVVSMPRSVINGNGWYFRLRPQGKSCLLRTYRRGKTVSWTRSGRVMHRFITDLPAGVELDCVFEPVHGTYHVLDLIAWGNIFYQDCEFTFRQFWLNLRFSDACVDGEGQLVRDNTGCEEVQSIVFHSCAPVDSIATIVDVAQDWLGNGTHPMDGVLFYHSQCPYVFGWSPLNLWWRWPAVCTYFDSYLAGAESGDGSIMAVLHVDPFGHVWTGDEVDDDGNGLYVASINMIPGVEFPCKGKFRISWVKIDEEIPPIEEDSLEEGGEAPIMGENLREALVPRCVLEWVGSSHLVVADSWTKILFLWLSGKGRIISPEMLIASS